MTDRLSFYHPATSPLHRANPLTKLVGVLAGLVMTLAQPAWLPALVGLIGGLSVLGRVGRAYLHVAGQLIVPACVFLFAMQSLFLPGGFTVLVEWGWLRLTQESLMTAATNAGRVFWMVSAFTLFMLTTHPADLMSDLGRRGLPHPLVYVLVSTLHLLPHLRHKAQAIMAAQRARGLETEGPWFKRWQALLPLVGPLVFGALAEVEERALALEARAWAANRPKTALRAIPDSPTDRWLRWGFAALAGLALVLAR